MGMMRCFRATFSWMSSIAWGSTGVFFRSIVGMPSCRERAWADLLLRGQPEADDHLPELSPLRALLPEGARQPLLVQEADLEEEFPQPFLRHFLEVLLAGGGFPADTLINRILY